MGKALSVWTRYGSLGASSRLRFTSFFPLLCEAGWELSWHHFYEDDYLKQLYRSGRKDPGALWRGWRRRSIELRRTPENCPMLIEYELFPYLPWLWEKRFLHGRPYILNFDDAVFLRYAHIPGLSGKYESLCRHASGIIAANEELKRHFSRFQERVVKIPTVPPLSGEDRNVNKEEQLTLVWTGTPVTYEYLLRHAPVLREMARKVPFQLYVIASADLPGIPGVPTKCFDWSPEREGDLLAAAHIGIMPLPDTPFARGKSAYKLIRYAAAGLPAIASPVGENNFVIRQGKTGYLAGNSAEWINALELLASEQKRREMVPAIRETAAAFSRKNAGRELCRFLAECF